MSKQLLTHGERQRSILIPGLLRSNLCHVRQGSVLQAFYKQGTFQPALFLPASLTPSLPGWLAGSLRVSLSLPCSFSVKFSALSPQFTLPYISFFALSPLLCQLSVPLSVFISFFFLTTPLPLLFLSSPPPLSVFFETLGLLKDTWPSVQ